MYDVEVKLAILWPLLINSGLEVKLAILWPLLINSGLVWLLLCFYF